MHSRLMMSLRLCPARGPENDSPRQRNRITTTQFNQRAYWNRVEIDFSRPGKPSDNAFIESIQRSVRQELLNQRWFDTLSKLDEKLPLGPRDYN